MFIGLVYMYNKNIGLLFHICHSTVPSVEMTDPKTEPF